MAEDLPHHLGIGERRQHDHGNGILPARAPGQESAPTDAPPRRGWAHERRDRRSGPGDLSTGTVTAGPGPAAPDRPTGSRRRQRTAPSGHWERGGERPTAAGSPWARAAGRSLPAPRTRDGAAHEPPRGSPARPGPGQRPPARHAGRTRPRSRTGAFPGILSPPLPPRDLPARRVQRPVKRSAQEPPPARPRSARPDPDPAADPRPLFMGPGQDLR
jgi:hypothetical protein